MNMYKYLEYITLRRSLQKSVFCVFVFLILIAKAPVRCSHRKVKVGLDNKTLFQANTAQIERIR